jgi:hypothetical protein
VEPYLPLAKGNTWTYDCGTFSIRDSVRDTVMVNGHVAFAYALQIPDSAGHVTTEVQILANDSAGNTTIDGYMTGGAVTPVSPAVIVSANPVLGSYDYPAQGGGTVTRVFKGIDNSHPTVLGTFTNVAVYGVCDSRWF